METEVVDNEVWAECQRLRREVLELKAAGGWLGNLVGQYLTYGALDGEQGEAALERWRQAVR